MKVIFMEKFDGESADISLTNGRDPRFSFNKENSSGRDYTVIGTDHKLGLYGKPDALRTNYDGVHSYVIRLSALGDLEHGKRYSLLLNGLILDRQTAITRVFSNSYTADVLELVGVSIVDVANPTYIFPENFLDIKLKTEYNIELILTPDEDLVSVDIYVNDVLRGSRAVTKTEEVVRYRTGSHYSSGYTSKQPYLSLKEMILIELEEGGSRVGPMTLARISHTVNEGKVFDDELEISFDYQDLAIDDDGEMHSGVRLSARALAGAESMNVNLLDVSGESIQTKSVNLTTSHTRDSSCITIPDIAVDGSEHDISTISLNLRVEENVDD